MNNVHQDKLNSKLVLFLDRVSLRSTMNYILKIDFEPKLTLFWILEFMLLLSLRTHGHCYSTQHGMKPMNTLSRSKSTVKVRTLISSCQTLVMPRSKFRHVMLPQMYWQHTKVHHTKIILR